MQALKINFYFAYGSNMNADVLAKRLDRDGPTSLRRRRAVLRNYELVFNKMSSTDPTIGYANIVPTLDHHVEGVLNELTDDELARLDAIELVPHHYLRSRVLVHDDPGTAPIAAHVYTAHPAWIRPELVPLRRYLDQLLAGADLLSADYVETLRSVFCRD